jgi:hypothetical protein
MSAFQKASDRFASLRQLLTKAKPRGAALRCAALRSLLNQQNSSQRFRTGGHSSD